MLPNYIGNGQYLAFENFFACRDERESMWRLSRITTLENRMIQFTYIDEFNTRSDVLSYIGNNLHTSEA